VYHRYTHGLAARSRWQRVDHATIFAAIAGSFTPICLLAVPDRWGIPLLTLMWGGSVAGAAMKFTNWRHRRIVGGVLYGTLGGLGLFVIEPLWQAAGIWTVLLMLLGGAFYTVGAVLLNIRRPRLWPAVFGYHEVWHACTIIAGVAHFGAVWSLTAAVSG
jgi:hemolysin III